MEGWDSIGLDICLSGGAEGADLQFGMNAGRAGHRVFHFVFDGHRSRAPEAEKVTLSAEQLLVADSALAIANKTLQRRFPGKSNFVNSLLRRNYYQVCDSQSVYAAAGIDDDGLVMGGTSWAVQLFLDRFKEDRIPAYVFDQNSNGWFEWDCGWSPIDQPPSPTGVYAGIGSRELTQAGKEAIRALYS